MKSFKTTLILLVVVAAVGGYIWFNERGPIADQNSTVLLRTDPARVQQIKLVHNGSAIELQRSGEFWKVQKQNKSTPAAPADKDAVKNLLDSLQLLQAPDTQPVEAGKLKEFGLEKPQTLLNVDGQEIALGASPSFDAARVYARIGDRIALLPNALKETASKPFADWRDKAALRVDAGTVEKLEITAPKVQAVFVAQPKEDDKPRAWKITQPIAATADESAVNNLISQLPTTQATKFLDENPKDLKAWGLDKPQAIIEAGDQTLKIGRKTSGGYAAQNSTSPAVFEMPAALFEAVNRPLKDWRAKKVLDFKFEDVARFEIKARGASKTLEMKDKKWQLAGGQAEEGVHQAAFDVLLALQSLSAQEFIDQPQAPATYGLDKPAIEVSFNKQTVQLGGKGGKVYARVAENGSFSPTVYEVPPSTLDSLKQSLDILFK